MNSFKIRRFITWKCVLSLKLKDLSHEHPKMAHSQILMKFSINVVKVVYFHNWESIMGFGSLGVCTVGLDFRCQMGQLSAKLSIIDTMIDTTLVIKYKTDKYFNTVTTW